MSLIIPHCLLVGGCSKDNVLQAHKKPKEILNPKGKTNKMLSELRNVSFLVLCD
ncbi:hypothetical protein JDS88_28935, partial [Bacillus cereus]|nr:hypothetical protein [Bacillus cereus]